MRAPNRLGARSAPAVIGGGVPSLRGLLSRWPRFMLMLCRTCAAVAGSGGCLSADERLATAPPATAAPVAVSGRAMGTSWSAKWLPASAALEPSAVARSLAATLERLERQFSTYRPDSELARFNRAHDTGWLAVSPELARVAHRAREISALTSGAFDPTIAPLLELWGFGPFPARDTWPTAAEIFAARARAGWARLEVRLDPPALRKADPRLAADFSSIAKGFAVDALSAWLAAHGATNHLVRLGGDLRAAGHGSGGHGWPVAIEQPVGGPSAPARIVVLANQALSTSGNTRNFIVLGGRRLGHLLDPRTGSPAAGPLASASVVATTCADSSALATGLFVLGADAGPALATRERLAALFLVGEGSAFDARPTPDFAARFSRGLPDLAARD